MNSNHPCHASSHLNHESFGDASSLGAVSHDRRGNGTAGLQCELVTTGSWLFRWRSFLPVTLVIAAILAMLPFPLPKHDSEASVWLEGIAIGISLLGMLIRAWTVGHTPAGTSGRNTASQVAESLNTTGIYSIVRHPLYLANFFIGLGLACYSLTWWFVVIFTLVFWLYYERIMMAEEAFLSLKFGDNFREWALRTPAFLPRFNTYVPAPLPFSFRNVLRREYNTLLQIVVVVFILEVCGDWFENRELRVSNNLLLFILAGTTVWGVLRTLKRNTDLLDVDGR